MLIDIRLWDRKAGFASGLVVFPPIWIGNNIGRNVLCMV